MTLDENLDVVSRTGAKLDEQRTEDIVESVEMIEHGSTSHDPRIGLSRLGIAALLGTKNRCLLLALRTNCTFRNFLQ
jgi:hypothetical protein